MSLQLYPHIQVAITKCGKIRAKIKESKGEKSYKVSVGGISWRQGTGLEHTIAIRAKASKLLCRARVEYDEFLQPKK
jgi:hypothetical protein